jgi:hypothetical protein
MVNKTLDFLEVELDRNIKNQDLTAITLLFRTIKEVKELINI